MKVCVIGSGGREHALADVLGRDAEVVVTPGNPGIPGSVATPPEELEADQVLQDLMGKDPSTRYAFIMDHAAGADADDLDL